VSPLRTWQRQPQRGLVRLPGLLGPPQFPQQLGPGDVKLRPAGQPDALSVQDAQARGGLAGYRDRHRPVSLGHRRRLVPGQLPVQRGDLRPVRLFRTRMARRDGRVQLVGPGPPGRQRPGQPRLALDDQVLVPLAAVLVRQRHELPAPGQPRRPSRVGEQQQGQQPGRLRLPGEQRGQRAGQPDGLVAQLPADQRLPAGRPVPLGEDQVDHAEHRTEPPGQVLTPRHPERDPGLPDLPLGPHQPLRHRRLRHQKGGRDLRRGQPAHAAQRQRHPRLRIQRRMTAHKDQPKLIILTGSSPTHISRLVRLANPVPVSHISPSRPGDLDQPRGLGLLDRTPALPPQPVQGLVPRRAGQPGAGVGRHPGDRPGRDREEAGLLYRVLGGLEVPEHLGERGHGRPPAVAEQVRVLLTQR
jgi:hypothetical protein